MVDVTASGSSDVGGVLAPPAPRRQRSGGFPPVEPPDGWGGDDDWNSDGSDDDEPQRPGGTPPGAAELALGFGLVGVGTLFTVFLGAGLLLRKRAAEWPTAAEFVPPDGLWVSTLCLFLSSLTIELARRSTDGRRLLRGLAATLALGALFLGAQAWIWRELLLGGLKPSSDGYGTMFYALTGLHALHIVVGLGLLVARYVAAKRSDDPTTGRRAVRLVSLYWHFMSALWIAIFGALYLQ